MALKVKKGCRLLGPTRCSGRMLPQFRQDHLALFRKRCQPSFETLIWQHITIRCSVVHIVADTWKGVKV